jgi:hypothetical protein
MKDTVWRLIRQMALIAAADKFSFTLILKTADPN